MIEILPSALSAFAAAIVVILALADNSTRRWAVPLAWFFPAVTWNTAFVAVWLWPEHQHIFGATAGTVVTLTAPAIFLMGRLVTKQALRRSDVVFAYASSLLVLVPATLLRALDVSGRIFGILQFPYVLMMDAACVTLLWRSSREDPRLDVRRFAQSLAALLTPSFAIGGLSYYLSYVRFGNPHMHAWFGDLAITGGIVGTYVLWRRGFVPANPKWKRVFIVYGRNTSAHREVGLYLEALGLEVFDLRSASAACGTAAHVSDVVRYAMQQAQAIIVVFTDDELAALRPEYRNPGTDNADSVRWQARPNVLFEAGLAFGVDQNRTILVTLGSHVSLFSDLAGVHFVRLDNTKGQRQFLREKLIAAGCPIKDGNAGSDVGDFECAAPREHQMRDPFQ